MRENEKAFTTSTVKGQTDYPLHEEMHNITRILVNGKKVEIEVFFRIKRVPRKYGQDNIKVFIEK